MSTTFTAKHVKFPGPLKAYVEKQLKNIEKISGDIISADITVSQEKLHFIVELILKTKMHSYQVEDSDAILKQALRKALATLKAQAKKNKEKLKREKKRLRKQAPSAGMVRPARIEEPTGSSEEKIRISNNYSPKPLSIEEAVFFLKESGDNAYMFVHAETGKPAVVFVDRENGVSLIEAV